MKWRWEQVKIAGMNEIVEVFFVPQAPRIEQGFESRSVHFAPLVLFVRSRLEPAVPLECDERSENGPQLMHLFLTMEFDQLARYRPFLPGHDCP